MKTSRSILLKIVLVAVFTLLILITVLAASIRGYRKRPALSLERVSAVQQLDQCMIDARERFSARWEGACLILNQPKDCILAQSMRQKLIEVLQQEQKECEGIVQ